MFVMNCVSSSYRYVLHLKNVSGYNLRSVTYLRQYAGSYVVGMGLLFS